MKLNKKKARLERRTRAFKEKDGTKRPGSMNGRKS